MAVTVHTALSSAEGVWLSKNDINIGKESSSWHEQIDTYIDDLDNETVLVSVDYHI